MMSGQRGSPPAGPEALTEREREIVKLFASGRSYAQIAEARGNKVVTVRNSIYRIQNKLGVDTKTKRWWSGP